MSAQSPGPHTARVPQAAQYISELGSLLSFSLLLARCSLLMHPFQQALDAGWTSLKIAGPATSAGWHRAWYQ